MIVLWSVKLNQNNLGIFQLALVYMKRAERWDRWWLMCSRKKKSANSACAFIIIRPAENTSHSYNVLQRSCAKQPRTIRSILYNRNTWTTETVQQIKDWKCHRKKPVWHLDQHQKFIVPLSEARRLTITHLACNIFFCCQSISCYCADVYQYNKELLIRLSCYHYHLNFTSAAWPFTSAAWSSNLPRTLNSSFLKMRLIRMFAESIPENISRFSTHINS